MAETLVPGRYAHLYVAAETPYGTPPTLLATHAMRHVDFKVSRPETRVPDPAKKASPGMVRQLARRTEASCSVDALIQPSGTLNTLGEADALLTHGMGAKSNITLSTTVSASPTPTTTVFTVAAVTGLVVGQAILVACTGGTYPGKYVRWITNIATLALTVAPALPQAPATSDVVKGCCTYSLANEMASSLCLAHYRTSDTVHSQIVKGAVAKNLAFSFEQNTEARLSASFQAKSRTKPAPTKPAAFTMVGTQNPPSGITGELYVASAAYKFIKLDAAIDTGVELRTDTFGFDSPESILMTGRRKVELTLAARLGDQAVIYDPAAAGTRVAIMMQTGFTEGNIIALYAPLVEFSVPDEDSPEDVPTWSFKGLCCESVDGQNDELRIAFC